MSMDQHSTNYLHFLSSLQKEHIKRFNVTWELHNKHLVQSIVYTDPAIHNSLHVIVDQLRLVVWYDINIVLLLQVIILISFDTLLC